MTAVSLETVVALDRCRPFGSGRVDVCRMRTDQWRATRYVDVGPGSASYRTQAAERPKRAGMPKVLRCRSAGHLKTSVKAERNRNRHACAREHI
jgi:hypothetical protein